MNVSERLKHLRGTQNFLFYRIHKRVWEGQFHAICTTPSLSLCNSLWIELLSVLEEKGPDYIHSGLYLAQDALQKVLLSGWLQ